MCTEKELILFGWSSQPCSFMQTKEICNLCALKMIVFILMKFSTLAALEVVILTTSPAANDENFIKMMTFSGQYAMELPYDMVYHTTMLHMVEEWQLLDIGQTINSLAPGNFKWNFRHAIFKQTLVIDGWGISCEIALLWMSLDFTDDLSTLVQVMAWCRQATSHYLNQCWPRSVGHNELTHNECPWFL